MDLTGAENDDFWRIGNPVFRFYLEMSWWSTTQLPGMTQRNAKTACNVYLARRNKVGDFCSCSYLGQSHGARCGQPEFNRIVTR